MNFVTVTTADNKAVALPVKSAAVVALWSGQAWHSTWTAGALLQASGAFLVK